MIIPPLWREKSPIFTDDVQQSERGFYGFTYLGLFCFQSSVLVFKGLM